MPRLSHILESSKQVPEAKLLIASFFPGSVRTALYNLYLMATKLTVKDAKGNAFNLAEIDGITFPEYFTNDPEKRLRDIKEMTARDDDVIIVAYPKAGTLLILILDLTSLIYVVGL